MKLILRILFMVSIYFILVVANAEHEETSGTSIVNLDPAAQKIAEIIVTTLQPQTLTKYVLAPGEVQPNADLTSKITTRVPAKIILRKVQEGQHVQQGETLLVLSSIDVSKNQGDLILAKQEWERVKSLGKDAISAKRYSEAQIAYQSAYQTALASGMSEADIEELFRTQKISQRKGEFELVAPRNGTIFNVNLTEGELAEPGRVLMQIVDEESVWVDARLPPELAHKIKIGNPAKVQVEGHTLEGNIIQVHHQLDETTRTRGIRIQVINLNDLLHPGQFVNCQIAIGETPPVLAVPVEAVMRNQDGDSAVYIEITPNHFKQVEVKVLDTINDQAIIEGITAGKRVVIKGAFFIHAELTKTGFEPHVH